MKYSNLYVVRLDREARARTCGYWYVVTSHCTAHCAHRTRKGLNRWLSERGLSLAGPLDEPFARCHIIGEYSTVYESPERIASLIGERITVLNNGDYGVGIVTIDDAGHRTVHVEHGEGRTIYDYQTSLRTMDEQYEENESLATAQ